MVDEIVFKQTQGRRTTITANVRDGRTQYDSARKQLKAAGWKMTKLTEAPGYMAENYTKGTKEVRARGAGQAAGGRPIRSATTPCSGVGESTPTPSQSGRIATWSGRRPTTTRGLQRKLGRRRASASYFLALTQRLMTPSTTTVSSSRSALTRTGRSPTPSHWDGSVSAMHRRSDEDLAR